MRISIVHSFYRNMSASGENTAVTLQARALASAGHEVRVHAFESGREEWHIGSTARAAFRVATGYGRSPLKAIRAFSPDVVHIHNLFPNWASSWISDSPFPIAVTLHNFRMVCAAGTLSRNGNPCYECLGRLPIPAVRNGCYSNTVRTIPLATQIALRQYRSDAVAESGLHIALSERAAAIFRNSVPQLKKLCVLPNFVETPKAPALPVHSRTKNWLFVGRLSPEKGLDSLMKRWPKNRALVLIGSGPEEDRLRHQAPKNWTFLGQLSRDEVLKQMSSAIGVIVPSIWVESAFTNVVLEAIARGTPVVCREETSPGDLVQETGIGAVFDDQMDIEGALNHVETEWMRISKVCQSTFQERFTEETWIEMLFNNYAML